MSYITSGNSTSAVVDAVFTRFGKRTLIDENRIFEMKKFAVSDDDIPYGLITASNVFQSDPDILSLPISEPSTNEAAEQLSKIWVNGTFLGGINQFQNDPLTANGQYVLIETNKGNTATITSNDTTTKLRIWFGTYNPIDRPYVDDFYRIDFTNDIDFYSIQFESPALTDTLNNNYDILGTNSYKFSAVNKDGSGRYEKTIFGAPSVVLNVRFVATPMYYSMIQQPQFKNTINIPNFMTVTDIDSAGNPISGVRPATLPLQIINLLA